MRRGTAWLSAQGGQEGEHAPHQVQRLLCQLRLAPLLHAASHFAVEQGLLTSACSKALPCALPRVTRKGENAPHKVQRLLCQLRLAPLLHAEREIAQTWPALQSSTNGLSRMLQP